MIRWSSITAEVTCPPLGDELKKHLDGYKGAAAKAMSCSAWWLLYRTLVEMEEQPGNVAFEKNGKPYFTDKNLFFSIAHSRRLCAVVLSESPVGIDLESCQRKWSKVLWDKSLSEEEKTYYQDDFIRAWCRKESMVKLTGEGLNGYPANVDTLQNEVDFTEQTISYEGILYRLTVASFV